MHVLIQLCNVRDFPLERSVYTDVVYTRAHKYLTHLSCTALCAMATETFARWRRSGYDSLHQAATSVLNFTYWQEKSTFMTEYVQDFPRICLRDESAGLRLHLTNVVDDLSCLCILVHVVARYVSKFCLFGVVLQLVSVHLCKG